MIVSRLFLILVLIGLSGCIRVRHAIPSWNDAAADRLTLSARDGFIVPALINGIPVRLRVDTGYSDIVLNPGVAARVGVKPSRFGADLRVGPIRVNGQSGRALVRLGPAAEQRYIIWFDKDVAADVDGVINIAHLPYAETTLVLGDTRPDDIVRSVETTPLGFWSVVYRRQIGQQQVEVRLLLDAPRTMLTAAAGAVIGQAHGGSWINQAVPHRIAFDVLRPAREITFASPVPLDLVALDRALVRTSDNRGRHALPTDGPADPNEIVVTGQTGKSRAHFTVILGRDQLAGCSSLTYQRATRMLSLRCRRR
jgi:hypothetical protein